MMRGTANAESLSRDDVPILSYELADEARLVACPVDIRFAVGSETAPILREVTARLAALRGTSPEVVEGVGHAIHLEPDVAARYIEAASA